MEARTKDEIRKISQLLLKMCENNGDMGRIRYSIKYTDVNEDTLIPINPVYSILTTLIVSYLDDNDIIYEKENSSETYKTVSHIFDNLKRNDFSDMFKSIFFSSSNSLFDLIKVTKDDIIDEITNFISESISNADKIECTTDCSYDSFIDEDNVKCFALDSDTVYKWGESLTHCDEDIPIDYFYLSNNKDLLRFIRFLYWSAMEKYLYKPYFISNDDKRYYLYEPEEDSRFGNAIEMSVLLSIVLSDMVVERLKLVMNQSNDDQNISCPIKNNLLMLFLQIFDINPISSNTFYKRLMEDFYNLSFILFYMKFIFSNEALKSLKDMIESVISFNMDYCEYKERDNTDSVSIYSALLGVLLKAYCNKPDNIVDKLFSFNTYHRVFTCFKPVGYKDMVIDITNELIHGNVYNIEQIFGGYVDRFSYKSKSDSSESSVIKYINNIIDGEVAITKPIHMFILYDRLLLVSSYNFGFKLNGYDIIYTDSDYVKCVRTFYSLNPNMIHLFGVLSSIDSNVLHDDRFPITLTDCTRCICNRYEYLNFIVKFSKYQNPNLLSNLISVLYTISAYDLEELKNVKINLNYNEKEVRFEYKNKSLKNITNIIIASCKDKITDHIVNIWNVNDIAQFRLSVLDYLSSFKSFK